MKKSQPSPALIAFMIVVGVPIFAFLVGVLGLICLMLISVSGQLWNPWGALIAAVALIYLVIYWFVKLSLK